MTNAEFIVIYNSREDNKSYLWYFDIHEWKNIEQKTQDNIYKMFIIPMAYEDISPLNTLQWPELAHRLVDLFHEHAQKVIYVN